MHVAQHVRERAHLLFQLPTGIRDGARGRLVRCSDERLDVIISGRKRDERGPVFGTQCVPGPEDVPAW